MIALLAATAVRAGYEPGLDIVTGASLELAAGEILAVLGPNGAGKSTLVKAVAGLVPVRAGRVTLAGQDLTEVPAHERIGRGLAYVPQTENVFATLTIRENLELAGFRLGRGLRPRLEAMWAFFPDLAERPDLLAGRLSGGQRQMLAVARALLVEPQALMLDEPSAGLSPRMVETVFAKLAQIRAGGTAILLVEQNVDAALRLADRALVMVEGRERLVDAPAALRGSPVLARLFLGGGRLMLQYLADGLVLGSMIGLGAVGLTLTYSVLRFANFTHGELITVGAYLAHSLMALLVGLMGAGMVGRFGPFSFGWPLLLALLLAVPITGGVALLLDSLLFGRLRGHGTSITLAIASFGAAMALRNLVVVLYGPTPDYYSRAIQIALPLVPREVLGGLRMTPDQLAVVGVAAAAVLGLHLLLTRTTIGRAMRAVSENATLAAVIGLDVRHVIRWTWLIGGGLACLAGVLLGITVQVRPQMGLDLLLPLFAAAILGGIGSPIGAVLGGLLIGIAESLAVPLIGADYRAAVAFLVLILVLVLRPQGILGEREAA